MCSGGRLGGAQRAGCSLAQAGACTCVCTVQGVCTARAGRAPVRPPSSAAIQGQRRRVKIPRKTLAREPRGAGWGNQADAHGRALTSRLSVLMRSCSTLRRGRKLREFPRTPRRPRAPGTRTRPRPTTRSAYPLVPWRAPRAVCGKTARAGIKGRGRRGCGLAGTSQWAGEGRAGAELMFRAPIGQLALRYADTVESRARGRDDFLLEAKAGRGRGRERPVWLKRGEGGSCQLEQQDGRGGSSAPQRDGPGSRSRRRRPRCPAALSVAPAAPTAADRAVPAPAALLPPPPPPRARPSRRRRERSRPSAERRAQPPPPRIAGRAGAAVPPAGARRRARRGVAGAGPGPAGTRRRPPARAAAAAARAGT